MTSSQFLIVIVVLAGATTLRMFESRRFIDLDDMTKGKIIAEMHGIRQMQGFATIAILAVGLGPMFFGATNIVLPIVSLWVLVVVAGAFGIYNYRRLRVLEAPDSYLKAFAIRNVLSVLGIALVAVSVLLPDVFV